MSNYRVLKDHKTKEQSVKNNRNLKDRHIELPKEKKTRPIKIFYMYIATTEKCDYIH